MYRRWRFRLRTRWLGTQALFWGVGVGLIALVSTPVIWLSGLAFEFKVPLFGILVLNVSFCLSMYMLNNLYKRLEPRWPKVFGFPPKSPYILPAEEVCLNSDALRDIVMRLLMPSLRKGRLDG